MIAYVLSTVRTDKSREWRTKFLPSKIEDMKLNLPNVLAGLFNHAPVFYKKKEAVAFIKEFVKTNKIKDYTIVLLKRDFVMFSFTDMEESVNPYVHTCGDCGNFPAVSYNANNQRWSISCFNINCQNGFVTAENKMYLAVNEWNKQQQKRQFLSWREEDDKRRKD